MHTAHTITVTGKLKGEHDQRKILNMSTLGFHVHMHKYLPTY